MILVTGGSGFIGQAVVRRLLEVGHDVRVLARDAKGTRELFKEKNVDVVEGDILDSGAVSGACQGVNGVIHLVGIISEVRGQTFERVHVKGTECLLAAAEAAGVPRFLYLSAIGTREEAPSAYHQSKWEAEEAVRKSNMAWTIFRPSLVYGAGDMFTNLYAGLCRFPWNWLTGFSLPCVGDGTVKLQPVEVGEVAAAVCSALSSRKAIGMTYDLVGETITMREMLEEIGKALGGNPEFVECSPQTIPFYVPGMILAGKRPVIIPWPVPFLKIKMFLFETLCKPFWECCASGMLPKDFQKLSPSIDHVTMLEENQYGNNADAAKDLGFRSKTFRDGISGYLTPFLR